MSSIKFIALICSIIQALEFYNLKYGHLIVNYYSNEYCTNDYSEQIVYDIPDNDEIKVLNKDGNLESYGYSFNFFSSSIFYTNGTEDEEEDENDYIVKKSFLCNGICNKRKSNSDILVDPGTEIIEDYQDLNDRCKSYSCIYNNIIKTATIKLIFYNDKKCKKKEDSFDFNGTTFCWNITGSNENKGINSFKPLYYEDGNDRIYYHPYSSNNCSSQYLDYFVIDKNYLICDSDCHSSQILDNISSYKCIFNSNKGKYIIQNILLYLFLILNLFL